METEHWQEKPPFPANRLAGGIDERVLISNDKNKIDKELLDKILSVVRNGGGYILHSDRS